MVAPLPSKHVDGDDRQKADSKHQRTGNTGAGRNTDVVEHVGEPNDFKVSLYFFLVLRHGSDLPERTNKSPDLANKRDENTNTTRVFRIAIHSIGDQNGRHELITKGSNGCAYDW